MKAVENRYNSVVNARTGPLLAWLAIQIITLSLGAMRLPLSARAGSEPQHLALAEMIVVQITVATMLFPILLRDGLGMSVALTSLPFLQLSALLTATPVASLVGVWLGILMWIGGLHAWNLTIRSDRSRLVAVAVLNCIVLGGPVSSYLIREFSDVPDQPDWRIPAAWDPVTSLLRQASESTISWNTLSGPAVFLVAGAVAVAMQRRRLSRAKLST